MILYVNLQKNIQKRYMPENTSNISERGRVI